MIALLPESAKRFLRPAIERRFDVGRASLSAETRRRLEEALAEDVRALRAILGPQFHGWGIA